MQLLPGKHKLHQKESTHCLFLGSAAQKISNDLHSQYYSKNTYTIRWKVRSMYIDVMDGVVFEVNIYFLVLESQMELGGE